jgi:hypothetical protein
VRECHQNASRIWAYDEYVTLILGMSKADGVYLSVDYRVTDARTRKLVDDQSVKYLVIEWPPMGKGTRAVLAYTGLARLADGTPTGTWIRETVRGDTQESFDRTMQHLRRRLNRDVGPLKLPLLVNLLVTHGARRYLGAFSNMPLRVKGDPTTAEQGDSFGYLLTELEKPLAFANGLGAARVAADGHIGQLIEQLQIVPRRPEDHMKLLATINRRVAAQERTVSPWCHVSFLPWDGVSAVKSQTSAEAGESVPFEMPFVFAGIDLTDMSRTTHQRLLDVKRVDRPGSLRLWMRSTRA